MQARRLIPVLLLALLAAIWLGGSWYFSGLLVQFQTNSLADQRERHGDPAGYGLPAPQEVTLQGEGGVALEGWLFRQTDGAECGVILLHGRSSSRYGMLKYGPLFWPRGCDLLLYDHRYHGGSAGEYGTYGYYESRDALAVLAWFEAETGLRREQIALFGESYGGATALLAAEQAPGLAFVGVDSVFADLQTIVGEQAEQQFGRWTRLFTPLAFLIASARADFKPGEVAPVVASADLQTPVFLSHSASDGYTLPDHSRRIAGSLPPTLCHRLYLTDWGSAHANSISDNPATYASQMAEFLTECAVRLP